EGFQSLACFSAPLALSVHIVVSFDFGVSQLPGCHPTILPPSCLAGAIFSGFAMVNTLMLPARAWLGLKDIVPVKHIENMNKIILLTGSLVGYAYAMEFFIAWYSGNEYEGFTFINRAFGPYWWAYWTMVTCNVLSPQLFWFKRVRTSMAWQFVISIFINIGMWFERFTIIVTSLHRDFLPSSWDMYYPTKWEIMTLAGSFGLFFTMFCLFARFLPVAAISTVLGMFAFNQLPMLFHPLFSSTAFEKVTDDGFFISIESWDPKFNATEAERLLKSVGAKRVELIRRGEGAAAA